MVVPSDDEWYKAAYYDPALPGYYDYPTGTDTPPTCAAPGAAGHTANCNGFAFPPDTVTDVGSYTGSPSPYRMFDQGGNVYEWNELIAATPPERRAYRGGGWENRNFGFRVAAVPEPAQVLLVLTGGLVLAAARHQRRA